MANKKNFKWIYSERLNTIELIEIIPAYDRRTAPEHIPKTKVHLQISFFEWLEMLNQNKKLLKHTVQWLFTNDLLEKENKEAD